MNLRRDLSNPPIPWEIWLYGSIRCGRRWSPCHSFLVEFDRSRIMWLLWLRGWSHHRRPEAKKTAMKMRTSPKISLKTTQDSSLRHASETGKPQQDSSPSTAKNGAPHHPRKVPNVTFWSPKRRSYTAKATTKRRWEQAAKQASKPRKIALGGMHPKQGNPSRIQAQGVAKTQRHTTEALKERVTPPRQRPGEDEKKPQNKPQNHAR